MPRVVTDEQSAVKPDLERIIRNEKDPELLKASDTVQDQILELRKQIKLLQQQLLEVCLCQLIGDISFFLHRAKVIRKMFYFETHEFFQPISFNIFLFASRYDVRSIKGLKHI